MDTIRIKRGLRIPIAGEPPRSLAGSESVEARSVALLGPDYVGMKPTMRVAEGDRVHLGQALFDDKQTPGVVYAAPASGTVSAIHRGAKRMLLSVVISVDREATERDQERFAGRRTPNMHGLPLEELRAGLLEAGLWSAFRVRPFGRVPALDSAPHAVFVNAMDTNPLALDPALVAREMDEDFRAGLLALDRLAGDRPVFVCAAPDAKLPMPDEGDNLSVAHFEGPHPAGLSGTHMHFLSPVSRQRVAWSIGCQDVIAIGQLFGKGRLWNERFVALGGYPVERPAIYRTTLGADLEELCAGRLVGDGHRVISGSPLSGRHALGAVAFLGRYHSQVSVLREGRERELFGWLSPGLRRFSSMGIYLSSLLPGSARRFELSTSTNGSERAMVPTGNFERVMPLDILPTQLLRALIVGDIEQAVRLGCLELDEEDLALCTFVCSGKYEYGPILRNNLNRIEREG